MAHINEDGLNGKTVQQRIKINCKDCGETMVRWVQFSKVDENNEFDDIERLAEPHNCKGLDEEFIKYGINTADEVRNKLGK